MRKFAALGILAAGALAVAAPAGATATHHPHPAHPVKSHKCVAHRAAYIVSGTLVSWNATKTSEDTYTGAITVHVSKANHHAAGARGSDVTYTLDQSKVLLGKSATPPVAGARVKLIGKITVAAKKCTDQSGAGTINVRQVDIHAVEANK